MAQQLVTPPFANVDTAGVFALGTRMDDHRGNEYIYLGGVAGTVLGSAVTYTNGTFLTTLTVAASSGFVAFAMGATLLGQYGWYCINGVCPCFNAGTVATDAQVFIVAASPGQVDDAVVATDRIENARFVSTAAGAGTVAIRYPQAVGLG